MNERENSKSLLQLRAAVRRRVVIPQFRETIRLNLFRKHEHEQVDYWSKQAYSQIKDLTTLISVEFP